MKKSEKEKLIDKILDLVVLSSIADPRKPGDLIQKHFINRGVDLSELKPEDFNRRTK